jgi:hypothetical protein
MLHRSPWTASAVQLGEQSVRQDHASGHKGALVGHDWVRWSSGCMGGQQAPAAQRVHLHGCAVRVPLRPVTAGSR